MDVTTFAGQQYVVTSAAGCTVTDETGKLNLTVEAGKQAVFIAISGSVTVSDDEAVVIPFEGAAPAALGGGGGGSSSSGDCNVTITARDGIECGTNATTNGSGGCIAIGYNAQTKELAGNIYTSEPTSRNSTSVAYGAGTVAAARGVAVGGLAKAGNFGNMADEANTAVGFNATATGANATATGAGAKASEYQATASGYAAEASTAFAKATGAYAKASGYYATASGAYANASGYYATATGSHVTATGTNATATGYYATATGFFATASGYASTAIGSYCWNDTDGTTAVLAGFEPPTAEHQYESVLYQMQFFVKDGKPHIGFTKCYGDQCGGKPRVLESYAVDLSQLPQVAWTPPASRYKTDADGQPVLKD